MSLISDLDFVACGIRVDHPSYVRLRAFIEQHEPWLPPRQPGFGPWIEYKPGDKGPKIGDVVHVLYDIHRELKRWTYNARPAGELPWRGAVAYCVKEDEA